MFRERSADRSTRLLEALPALVSLTDWVHIQWDTVAVATDSRTPLPGRARCGQCAAAERLRRAQRLRATLVVSGHPAPFQDIFRSDGFWHHVWEQRGRELFADRRRRSGAQELSAGHLVLPDGVLELGQDQDSLGGRFSARDAFSGNHTDFHLGDRALSPCLRATPQGPALSMGPRGPGRHVPRCCLQCLFAYSVLAELGPAPPSSAAMPLPWVDHWVRPRPCLDPSLQLILRQFDLAQFRPCPLQASSVCPRSCPILAV